MTETTIEINGRIGCSGGPPVLSLVRAVITALPLMLLLFPGMRAQETPPTSDGHCYVGTYRLADGRDVDIAPSDENDENLRWRMKDGTTGELTRTADGSWSSTLGWTKRPDGKRIGFGRCGEGTIRFDGVDGRQTLFDVFETQFQGAGVTLAGRLVMPRGYDRVPVVILVHGSEHVSAREDYALQRLFPSAGIGTFVYDKRGTGASGGRYTQNYLTLADDAIAAMHEAKRLAGRHASRIGYQGGSQAGWVAPLAAKIEAVDFLVISYGLAVSPLEEDRSCLALDLTRRGYGADALAKAMEVADSTSAVLLSNFREGYDRVEAVRQKYDKEPWFRYLHGNVSFLILERSPAELKELGPTWFPGIPLQYDPMPVLRNLPTPQLWLLGEDDIDAPSAETAVRLKALAASGSPITTAVFRGAEHGMYEYELAPNGVRLSTRQPESYFRMMAEFVRDGRLHGTYGAGVVSTDKHLK